MQSGGENIENKSLMTDTGQVQHEAWGLGHFGKDKSVQEQAAASL